MANWLWLIAHYQTRKGNQGGNQGDDSTGQHYSVTGRTLHMLIRPGEERGRVGQMEGGGKDVERVLKKYRNRFEKRIDCSDYKKKKKHAMPREGCRHSRKIIKTGKFTRLSDSEETDEIFLTRPQHRFGWIARILSPAQHLCWKQAKLYLQPLLFWLKSYSWKCPKNSNTHKSVSLISPSGGMNMLLPPHPTPPPTPPSSSSSPTDTALLRGAPQTGQTEFDFN